MGNHNPEIKTVLDDLLVGNPLVRQGKMFGYPAYYVAKKLCICLYEEGIGVKLPAETVDRMLKTDPHAIPFQPLGKPRMREWVQINLDQPGDYRQYLAVFEESIAYLVQQQNPGAS